MNGTILMIFHYLTFFHFLWRNIFENAGLPTDVERLLPEFSFASFRYLAAEHLGHDLMAIADAKDGDAEFEYPVVGSRASSFKY